MDSKLWWILVILILIPKQGESKRMILEQEECNPEDLKGLTSFKAGIHLDSSNRLEAWVGSNCCKWVGVYCSNTTGRVAELRLPGFLETNETFSQTSMVGWLSPSITLLTSLEVLDLGWLISLSGTIPSSIGFDLPSLRILKLSLNNLTGPIPESIGKLSRLEEIFLDGNSLSGQIPSSIGRLSQLIFLNISNNLIEGPLPSEMSSLHNLQSLDLSFTRLNISSIPKWLGEMPSLRRVFLAGVGIQGNFPELFQTTPSPLLELDLSFNNLIGIIPEWLGNFTRLYKLNLSRNSFESKIPSTFTSLNDLGVLDLHSNMLTGLIDVVFLIEGSFPGGTLTYVDLSDNLFSGEILEIGTGPQTTTVFLNLSNNYLQGHFPDSIGRLVSLRSLDLSYNKLIFGLPEYLANVSSLEKLKLQRNGFTGEIPNGYLKLKALRELDLSDNGLVGKIPDGAPLSDFPRSSFSGNIGLCEKPLSPCKF